MISIIIDAIFWGARQIHTGLVSLKVLTDTLFGAVFTQVFLILSIALAGAKFLLEAVNKAWASWTSVNESITSISQETPDISYFAQGFAVVNYIAPLQEAILLCLILFALCGATLIYRLVKSWIPTVS